MSHNRNQPIFYTTLQIVTISTVPANSRNCTLNISTIYVDIRLGEYIPMANRCFQSHKQEERQITLLSHENAAKCVGSNIDLIWDREGGGYPPDYPAADNLSRRVLDVIPSIAAQCNDKNVLIVTHGDIVNAYLPELAPGLGIGAFAADVAGWAVLRGPHATRVASVESILEMYRIERL